MLPELGHFALILGLCLALVQAVLPLWGSFTGHSRYLASARPAAYGQLLFIALAFLLLTQAFLANDFSVLYVANNSNSQLPLGYKISAVWSAHEGSLLLWVLLLSAWGAAVAWFSRALPQLLVARVLAVMGMISIGFLLFILLTSNPFERLDFLPAEGRDLNPLLQDIGLVIHPPMLYMGYVGLSVAFSFAIAALLGGRLDATWARWSRPWTLVAWVFLTLGIALGSWWAYYELGWGGWWFWDPVENASFMPWLVATALIHSLAMTEKRGAFKSWTVLLAICGFSLSLLGTFLVRSGVLTSVHAFATDPARGLFILIFLCVVIGGSLSLYAWRGPRVSRGGSFEGLSREALLLANNVLLVAMAGFVLLGTLAPLVYEAFDLGKISVGFPWFNTMFLAFAPLLAVLIGLGPLTRWKAHPFMAWLQRLRWLVLFAALVALLTGYYLPSTTAWLVVLGLTLAAWVAATAFAALLLRARDPRGWWQGLRKISPSYYGMCLAHFGVAVFIVGITLVSHFQAEKDLSMRPGEDYQLADLNFRFDGVSVRQGPNYRAVQGKVTVSRDGVTVATIYPEKRRYLVQTQAMTEAGIDASLWRDLYVSLGESLGDQAWSLRLYYKPFVRWIWLGAVLMALGGLLALSDRRYRLAGRQRQPVMASEAG